MSHFWSNPLEHSAYYYMYYMFDVQKFVFSPCHVYCKYLMWLAEYTVIISSMALTSLYKQQTSVFYEVGTSF